MVNALKSHLFFAAFLLPLYSAPIFAWSWNSAENVMPSLREDLDKEIAAYRQKVGNGLSLHERIIQLDRLIQNYKPLGLNVVDLETEQSRLLLQEKQQQLRASEAHDQATLLHDKGVAEYKDGQFQMSLDTFREAERLLPEDDGIKETRRRLEGVTPILELEVGQDRGGTLLRLAVCRYLVNDIKRAFNTLTYAQNNKIERPEIGRLAKLIETNHPEVESPRIPTGITLIDHKLQLSLEAIYDGRYLTAISECADVLDLEPNNVLAMTRLGSA